MIMPYHRMIIIFDHGCLVCHVKALIEYVQCLLDACWSQTLFLQMIFFSRMYVVKLIFSFFVLSVLLLLGLLSFPLFLAARSYYLQCIRVVYLEFTIKTVLFTYLNVLLFEIATTECEMEASGFTWLKNRINHHEFLDSKNPGRQTGNTYRSLLTNFWKQ